MIRSIHKTKGTDAPRRSGCAARSWDAETARVRAMTVEERIRSALSMKEKFAGLKPVKAGPIHD